MLVTRAIASGLDLLDLHRSAPRRYPLLLESVAHGSAQGRWDLLLVADGPSLTLDRDGVTRCEHGLPVPGDFLSALDAQWQRARIDHRQTRWPFRGGWALLLGYELAAQLEPALTLPAAPGALPVAQALRCPAALLRDCASGAVIALAEAERKDLLDQIATDAAARLEHCARGVWMSPISIVEDRIHEGHAIEEHAVEAHAVEEHAVKVHAVEAPAVKEHADEDHIDQVHIVEDPVDDFICGVQRILDYLAAGDVFQVNLSRGWQAHYPSRLAPAALYQRLRRANPAPFAGIYAGADWAVVSASPERLVSVRADVIATRPIAGTRPRLSGENAGARVQELVANPKERAEHVMLIDLERNDLGRICVPGSVVVDELMTVESYAHVHHLVSNVSGRLLQNTTPGAVIAAVFPGGTITGCPKLRCMQIIAELERGGRGAYTGAIGWLNRDGDLDLNILIRSAELEAHERGSVLRFRAGAGIVADSEPERELEETRVKARGMLLALTGTDSRAAPRDAIA